MHENTKAYKDKSHANKNRTTNMSKDNSKTNIFNSKNYNIKGEDKDYLKKKRNRLLSDNKKYFKVEDEDISAGQKKQSSHKSNREIYIINKNNEFSKENVLSGIDWKKVGALIPTKTTAQVKSFAINLFYKMKSYKDDNLGIDFTLNSINNLNDMVNQIRSKYPNVNDIISILKKIANKSTKIRKFRTFHKKKKNGKKNNILFSNQNTQYFNSIEENGLNQLNNNINNNPWSKYKTILFNINYIKNNIIWNNFSCFDNVLINSLVNNKETVNDPFFNYLYQINHLLFYKVKVLIFIDYIYNIVISNLLNELKSFNYIPLSTNNNFYLINNNNDVQSHIRNIINSYNQINQTEYNNSN